MPLAFSSNAGLESEVIFAGYGFNINDDSLKWNDYKDIDVKGKWVMILRADPEPDNTKSPLSQFSSDRDKALAGKRYGSCRCSSGFRSCIRSDRILLNHLMHEGFSVDIPVLRIKREVADIILSKSENNNCSS